MEYGRCQVTSAHLDADETRFCLDSPALFEADGTIHRADDQLPSTAADRTFCRVTDEAPGYGYRERGIDMAVHRTELHIGAEIVGHFHFDGAIHCFDLQGAVPIRATHSDSDRAIHALSVRPGIGRDSYRTIYALRVDGASQVFRLDSAIDRCRREPKVSGQMNREVYPRVVAMYVVRVPVIAGLARSHRTSEDGSRIDRADSHTLR